MHYHVIHIETSFAEEWQKDIFDQQTGELGVDTIDGNDYYIPSDILAAQQSAILSLIADTAGAKLIGIEACEDKNWNEAWETEKPVHDLPLGIRIIPHCAFGAGYHETTSMMIDGLMQADLHNKTVLDHGTGTGVLAIFAKRLGASHVIAVDIDDKSVENAKENAVLNDEEIDVRLGDTVPAKEKGFDLILANIHRNVLLAHMSAYAASLAPEGWLWLSGFYESDCPALIATAQANGLKHIETRSNGEWRMIRLNKQ